ncbi:DUF2163 domain-containing protein [Rhizorhapis sp. SPR117]|uniref:DUF2163 domain-containing protein n=1 Tax=Rhizorhapis sp. SPR117 TaxID=2912611 RepID=UPI001F21E370|nr:DUF2163 domain-containing protein [Rhizorhapis sp. SPR117]
MEALNAELVALAFCWRLDRRDGVSLGLTSHDRDLVVGGFAYRAAPGMLPSAVSVGAGLDVDSMDVKGALTADAICEADLAAGRWDGAALRLYLTDWSAPGEMWLELARGELGAVERSGDSFAAELRGPVALLDGPVAPETSPDCRAALGDRDCRIDLSKRRVRARVASVDGESVLVEGGGLAAGAYGFGGLRWLDGANAGVSQMVAGSDATHITLTDAPPFAVAAGALVELTQGCDKRLDTCSARFGNAVNFRGEPHLPGNDLLTRYPGG